MEQTKTGLNPYNLTFAEWRTLLAEWGEPAYRARQVWQWLYRHLATDADAMTNLPKVLRHRLAETANGCCACPMASISKRS